jgi:hypothetical protein
MMSDKGKIEGYLQEARGNKERPKNWYFRDREDAARAVLAETNRVQGESTEARLAKEVLVVRI